MSELLTIQVPEDWVEGIPKDDLPLREIFRMGIYKYKIRQAIQLYKEGVGSLGYIADKTGVSKQDLIQEFRSRNMEPEFSAETLQEELE